MSLERLPVVFDQSDGLVSESMMMVIMITKSWGTQPASSSALPQSF